MIYEAAAGQQGFAPPYLYTACAEGDRYSRMMNISFLLVATIAVTAASASHRSCAPIHILAARGTGEAPGVGVISSLSDLVVRAHPGTTQEPIHYLAAVDPVSVKEGIDSVAD